MICECGHKDWEHRCLKGEDGGCTGAFGIPCKCKKLKATVEPCEKCGKPNTPEYHYQGLCNFAAPDKSIGKIDGDKVEKFIFQQIELKNTDKPEAWALFQSKLYGGEFK
jgi:hypothetical protein